MTLSEFLLARYAEEVAVASATQTSYDPLSWGEGDATEDPAWGMYGPTDGPSGYQVVIVDPARVLAECEAKRRIVGELQHDGLGPREWMLKVLATPYAAHPDYREEWRP